MRGSGVRILFAAPSFSCNFRYIRAVSVLACWLHCSHFCTRTMRGSALRIFFVAPKKLANVNTYVTLVLAWWFAVPFLVREHAWVGLFKCTGRSTGGLSR